jgi:hypothetical protein
MAKLTKRERTLLLYTQEAALKSMGSHDGSMFARGLSSEGWVGGYLAALSDIEAVLSGNPPSDTRRFWAEAERRLSTPAGRAALEEEGR